MKRTIKLHILVVSVSILAVIAAVSSGQSVLWKFEEGAGPVVSDSIAGQPARIHGDPVWVLGRLGLALRFDGRDDYLEIEPIAGLTSEQTKTLWVRVDSSVPRYEMYILDEGGTGNNNWIELVAGKGFGSTEEGPPSPRIRAGFDEENYVDSYTQLQLGRWYHVAVVSRSSGELAIFVNGELDVSVPDLSARKQPREIFIGTNAGSRTAFFAGDLDEVAIYNVALTSDQIRRLYQDGLVEKVDPVSAHIRAALHDIDAVRYLQQDGRFSDWAATATLEAALHVVDAVFLCDPQSPSPQSVTPGTRMEILKNAPRYEQLYENCSALAREATRARYSQRAGGADDALAPNSIPPMNVRDALVGGHLSKIIESAGKFLPKEHSDLLEKWLDQRFNYRIARAAQPPEQDQVMTTGEQIQLPPPPVRR